jgi:hypothetical protein
MFYFVHALLGGLIGLHFHSLLLIFSLAFLSHFLLDVIPHWDIGFDREHFKESSEVRITRKIVLISLFDLFLALFVVYELYHAFASKLLIFGAFASLLPDMISLGYFTKMKNKKRYNQFLHFHNNLQGEAGFYYGILTQLIIALILLIILF